MTYHGFVSYSHAADGKLAPALQRGVQGFARPWYRLRGARLFRDKTGMGVTPELWPAIEAALSRSRWFVLLASPQAAASPWVKREVEYWLAHASPERILIVLTEGEIAYDRASGAIDWSRTTALPEPLQPVLRSVPGYLDLRWARSEEDLSARNPRFRDALADIAAPLRETEKDQLVGEDVRLHRRTLQLAWSGALALAIVAALAVWQAIVANQQRALAEDRARAALSRQLATESVASVDADPTLSYRLAEAAVGVEPTLPAQTALFRVFDRRACFSRLTLGPHEALVADAAFSPDGTAVLTATYYDASRVWDVETGTERSRFGDDEIQRAVFSRDGARIYSVARRSNREALVLWDVSGEKVRAWRADEIGASVEQAFAEQTGFAWDALEERQRDSPDGTLHLRLEGRSVDLLDDREETVCRLVGHQDEVTAARFSYDGRRIVTASLDRTARVWELPARQPRFAEAREPRPTDARFRATDEGVVDTQRNVAARLDGTRVVLVDLATGKQLRELVGHSGTIDQVVFSPDGSMIATSCLYGLSAGEFDTSVRVWDVATGQQLRQLPGGTMNRIEFTPDGRFVVVNETGWPATWQEVLRAVAEDRVRGVPRELTAAEKQLHGLLAPATP